jgi:Carboxypeptidase regulatory-like domain
MLYLALPPTPPPILSTLTPQKVAGKASVQKKALAQNNGTTIATAQSKVCPAANTSQQSDLVGTILAKVLKNSNPAKTSSTTPVAAINCSSSVSKKTAPDKQKPAKGFSQASSAKTVISQATTLDNVEENSSLTASAKSDTSLNTPAGITEPQQSNSTNVSVNATGDNNQEKALEKNTIGKILATVQELINVSLYASINSAFGNVATDSQNNQQIAVVVSDTPASQEADSSKTPKKTNDNSKEIASNSNVNTSTQKILAIVQEVITASLYASLNYNLNNTVQSEIPKSGEIALTPPEKLVSSNNTVNNQANPDNNKNTLTNQSASSSQSLVTALKNAATSTNNTNNVANPEKKPSLELAQIPDTPFLVGVLINGREVGTLDILIRNNNLFVPLESFAEIARFTIEQKGKLLQAKTPLGVVNLQSGDLRQINGVVYIRKQTLQDKLKINVDLNTADINLLVDLPWRGGSGTRLSTRLKPDVIPPSTAFSTLQQELDVTTYSGKTDIRSSSLLGGRLNGGSWRVRLENDFENSPNLSEYFFFKRNGQFSYQVGKQEVGLHPLLNGISLTGLQFGYTNLPADSFNTNYSANELLPRRSQPVQSFSGSAPPASLVQLRVGSSIVAQQQVGFDGRYEFSNVNLPIGQNNQVELLIFDRNNLRVPREIRTVQVNSSDLLLPPGGNVQLAGLGITGNLVQTSVIGDSRFQTIDEGKLAGFYQLRQGLSKNLTFEGGVQALPDTVQAQAGMILRLANPAILSASVASSNGQLGYLADFDLKLDRLQISANSQSLPQRYLSGLTNTKEYFNHSLELKYNFGNLLDLGFVARSRQDTASSANYILPTFSARPFSTVFLSGRPDIDGRYLFNAFYQPTAATRLSFNTYGDTYVSDLSYKFNNNYQLSLGSEFGGGDAASYTARIGHTPNDFRAFSWNLGLGVTTNGEIGPVAGASMQILPGLLGRIEYQGIPARSQSYLGGFGNDRFSISLVSDLSFGGGRVAPAWSGGVSKERGAIAGQLIVDQKGPKFDLSGSSVRVYNSRNSLVGNTRTDSKGNFFVGNLPEGNYIVELEPDELPVELSVPKSSLIAQVANSAVTRLDFPLRAEYGLAGKVTDVAGQPVASVRIELMNPQGARVITAVTDQFGLYRLDGVPVGKYVLRVSTQDTLNPNDILPKRQIEIGNEFVYNQNLQLPISAASKKKS